MMKYTELLAENHRRLGLLPERRPYDPRTGEGCCGERTEVTTPLPDLPRAFVPVAMTCDADYSPRLGATAWERLRIRHHQKPDAATIRELKGNGFRWSPKNGAWQRQLTTNAIYAMRRAVNITPEQWKEKLNEYKPEERKEQ